MDWIEKMNVVGTAVDNAPETVQKTPVAVTLQMKTVMIIRQSMAK